VRQCLYRTDLEKNLFVCPKCSHHNRVSARERLDWLLDMEGRYEIGVEVTPVDSLKFRDSKRYPDRLAAARADTGEEDALVVMQGAIKEIQVVTAAFEFGFLGGSMGSVVGERFVRGVQVCEEQRLPFICFTATGGARIAGRPVLADADGKDLRSIDPARGRASAVHFGADLTRPWVAYPPVLR